MHFKIEKNQLANLTQIVTKAISSRSTLPILGGILLDVKKNNLTAYATDLEIAIKQSIELKTEEEAETVVPARLFLSIVKNLPEGIITVAFNAKNNNLELLLENSQFNINTLPVEDYPKFPDIKDSLEIEVNTNNFIKAINSINGSASKDESRPILTGILFLLSKNKIEFTATDSYRLATTNINISDIKEEEKDLIIPSKSLEVLAGMSPSADKIKISIIDNQVAFNFDNITITTKLIRGQFPDYKQLLPDKHEISLIVGKEEFLKALKRVSLMACNNSPLCLKVNDNKIIITTKTAEIGEAKEEIFADKTGSDIEIAFNAKYLIEGVSGVDEDNVLIKLIDPLQPGIISNKEKGGYKYLIMPIRLS